MALMSIAMVRDYSTPNAAKVFGMEPLGLVGAWVLGVERKPNHSYWVGVVLQWLLRVIYPAFGGY